MKTKTMFAAVSLAPGAALTFTRAPALSSAKPTATRPAHHQQPRTFAKLISRLLTLVLTLVLTASAQAFLFGPKGDSNAEKKANIRQQRDEMLAQLYATKPALKKVVEGAAGYATFKQVNVNLLLLATANGYGVVVKNKPHKEIFMRMGSLGSGVGAGVKDLRVIFIFHDSKTMKQFIEEGWQFGGQAEAAAKYQDMGVSADQNMKGGVSFRDGTVTASSSTDVRAGTPKNDPASASLATRSGMEIYQFTESGLALQAIVAGTKYWQDSKLNQ